MAVKEALCKGSLPYFVNGNNRPQERTANAEFAVGKKGEKTVTQSL